MIMEKKMLKQCKCGSENQDVSTDEMTNATFIECLNCGRVIASPDKDDALRMWNDAMIHQQRRGQ